MRDDQVERGRDLAVVRKVLAAACAVTGCDVEDAATGPLCVPELVLVRVAAAFALIDAGWSRERAAIACRTNRRSIQSTNDAHARMVRHAPLVLAAAKAAAPAAVAEVERPSFEATRAAAVEVIAEVAAEVGLDPSAISGGEGRPAVAARIRVAHRLVDRRHTVRAIALAMGWTTNAVYSWLARSPDDPHPRHARMTGR